LNKSIYEKCLKVYENTGQSGVFDFINEHFPNTEWLYCEPCEIESPQDGSCLVCGTRIQEVRV
jgi:hypothetical protein